MNQYLIFKFEFFLNLHNFEWPQFGLKNPQQKGRGVLEIEFTGQFENVKMMHFIESW